MTKPQVDREIKISEDKKMVRTISTITEQFTIEQFKETIKGKEKSLENLKGQKMMMESQKPETMKDSALLEKAKRLFGSKLGNVVSDFMNSETFKKNDEIIKGINQDIEIVEKDIANFKEKVEDSK